MKMAKQTRAEMLAKMRQKMEQRKAGRKDPDQFVAPKVKGEEVKEFYFRILPELNKGDTCKTGVCEQSADLWYYENGSHYVENQKYECPRTHDRSECPVCSLGFELLQKTQGKEARSRVAKTYLSRSYYAMNIWFTNSSKNPEELRGQVKWVNFPKTVWDKMDQCINNDDMGDSEAPKAAGLFYDPYEGGYTFRLTIKEKGEWPDYAESAFLPASVGPLVKNKEGGADEAAIQKILDQRFYLPGKFAERNLETLEELVNKLSGGTSKDDGDDDGEDGKKEEKQEEKVNPASIPGVTRGAGDAKKKAPPVDTDDDDGAPEMPEDEEEKPKPVAAAPAASTPAAAASKSKPVTDDDDDPELANLMESIKGKK